MNSIPSTQMIQRWLWIVAAMIVLMIAVGGITRLTESGLSMVDWKPLMGTIPPLNEGQWEQRFEEYKAFPEYQVLRPDMTLSEFKTIFFWEYIHRVLGRLIGLAFAVPYAYFLVRRQIPKGYQGAIFLAFVLGGAQGLLGWFMVMSGLIDNPRVSHFRLAAHFSLALYVFGYILWIILNLRADERVDAPKPSPDASRMIRGLKPLCVLLVLQVLYGAFTAGLDAGYSFNTFPRMMGRWLPPGMGAMEPAWSNVLSNPVVVQFLHRTFGWAILFGVAALTVQAFRWNLSQAVRKTMLWFAGAVFIQFLLGVFTLILNMPIVLASLHQVNVCLVVALLLLLFHHLRSGREIPSKAA